MGLDHI